MLPPGAEPLARPEIKINFVARSMASLASNKKANNFRQWLHTALQPIVSFRLNSITMNNYIKIADELKVSLEWVYGIRC